MSFFNVIATSYFSLILAILDLVVWFRFVIMSTCKLMGSMGAKCVRIERTFYLRYMLVCTILFLHDVCYISGEKGVNF